MKFWRIFFWVAASYNWLIGIPLFLAPGAAITGLGTEVPEDLALIRVAGALLFCFGILFAMVARDPDRYKPILWTGVFGKIGMASIFLPDWVAGNVVPASVIFTFGHIAFCVMFVVFLMNYVPATRQQKQVTPQTA